MELSSYRCIYLAVDVDIHACLTLGEEPTVSPTFKALGLLKYLTVADISSDFSYLTFPAGEMPPINAKCEASGTSCNFFLHST